MHDNVSRKNVARRFIGRNPGSLANHANGLGVSASCGGELVFMTLRIKALAAQTVPTLQLLKPPEPDRKRVRQLVQQETPEVFSKRSKKRPFEK
jgi:hypothetical protein